MDNSSKCLFITNKEVDLFNIFLSPFREYDKDTIFVDVYGTESLWDKSLKEELTDDSVFDTSLEVVGKNDLFLNGIISKFNENDNITEEIEFDYKILGEGKDLLLNNILKLVKGC